MTHGSGEDTLNVMAPFNVRSRTSPVELVTRVTYRDSEFRGSAERIPLAPP